MLPRGFIFASGALLRVQGGGSWLSSGSWNNEDVQYAYRNNWNCKRANKRSIDPNLVFRYSEEDVPKIAKQVFHGTESCTTLQAINRLPFLMQRKRPPIKSDPDCLLTINLINVLRIPGEFSQSKYPLK